MTIISLLGCLGNVLLLYSAIPELVRTIKAGKALGTALDLIATVLLGLATMWVYTFLKMGWDWILACNYGVQIIIWGLLLYYRIFRYKV